MGVLYTLRAGATAHPEDSVLQFITDLIASSGVVNLAGNHFKAEAQASPDMTVKINIGNAYIKGSSGNAYPVRLDSSSSNVTITSNASGNPRIDAIVLYIDKSAGPNTDASNVAKLIVVAGTPAASPVVPTDGEIQTAIGASNPFLRLADVTVSSGASSITNGNIADKRVTFTLNGAQLQATQLKLTEQSSTPSTPASGFGNVWEDNTNVLRFLADDGKNRIAGETDWFTLTDGSTVTIDLLKAKKYFLPLMGGNRTLALSNEFAGKDFALMWEQDGTGGRVPVWFSYPAVISAVDTSGEILTIGIDIPTGTPVKFITTGSLPGGLSAGTKYYAIRQSSTQIKVATSLANAQAGTAIDLTSSGSGTNTCNTQIRWPADTEPTPTSGKYKRDIFGISIVSTGVYEGCVISQDV